jgi:hypothetical protein
MPKRRNYCCEWCSKGGDSYWRSTRTARRSQLSDIRAVVQLDDVWLRVGELQKTKSKITWLRD